MVWDVCCLIQPRPASQSSIFFKLTIQSLLHIVKVPLEGFFVQVILVLSSVFILSKYRIPSILSLQQMSLCIIPSNSSYFFSACQVALLLLCFLHALNINKPVAHVYET